MTSILIIFLAYLCHSNIFCSERPPKAHFVTVQKGGTSRVGLFVSNQEKDLYINALKDTAFSLKQASFSLISSLFSSCLVGYAIKNIAQKGISSQYADTACGLTAVIASAPIMFSLIKKQLQKYNRRALQLPTQHVGEPCLISAYDFKGEKPLEMHTSFKLIWPPPSEYENKLDIQRFHAALISKTFNRHLLQYGKDCHCSWWVELPASLQRSVVYQSPTYCKIKNYRGESVIEGSHVHLDMDQLLSLRACIEKEYEKTKRWINGVIERDKVNPNAEIPDPPHLISNEKTLGRALWFPRETDLLPEGLHPLCPPFNESAESHSSLSCFIIHKDGLYRYAIGSTCRRSIKELKLIGCSFIETFYTEGSGSPYYFEEGLTTITSYALPLSLQLSFPQPERYNGKLLEQQYHSALSCFLKKTFCAEPLFSDFAVAILNEEEEKITINANGNWAAIKNMIIPFAGTFDWDAIQARFPSLNDALKAAEEQFNNKIKLDQNINYLLDDSHMGFDCLTAGYSLLGAHGTTTVNELFKSSSLPSAPRLQIPIGLPNLILVTLINRNGKKEQVIFTDNPILLILLFKNGTHMTTPTDDPLGPQSQELIKSYTTYYLDGYKEEELDKTLQKLKIFRLQKNENVTINTFDGAIHNSLQSPLPTCYPNRKKYTKHNALRLFLKYHLEKDDNSDDESDDMLIPIPNRIARSLPIQHNKKHAFARMGNLCFRYLVFPWGRVQERYQDSHKLSATDCDRVEFTHSVTGKDQPEVECLCPIHYTARQKVLLDFFDKHDRWPKDLTNLLLTYLYGFLWNTNDLINQ